MLKGAGSLPGPQNFSRSGKGIRILGVDPGLLSTGFGIIEIESDGSSLYCGSGAIRPRARQSFSQRIQQIFRGLSKQIENYAPQLMAVECPFFAKNVKSAMLLGQMRGVAILAAAEAGLEIQEFSPLEVKQAVVGYGRAAKEQVQAMVRSLLQTPPDLTTDAADALAVALCLAHCLSWQKSLESIVARRCSPRTSGLARAGNLDLGDDG